MWRNHNKTRLSSSAKLAGRRRRGAVVLELILVTPIWLIFLLAIIEFGEVYANRQQVALASRVGAEAASETPGLASTVDGDPVPANVLEKIHQQLGGLAIDYCDVPNSSIQPCAVVLEHNLSSSGTVVRLVSGDDKICYPHPDPATRPDMRRFVRLTVYVRMDQVTPNLLKVFGFDVSERVLQHTTTFRHELPPSESIL